MKREKNQSLHKNNNFRLLVFPETEAEIPAFENALMDEFEQALKRPDCQMRVTFVFPGRSQAEAQRIGAEFTRELDHNFREVRQSWGME